MSFYHFVKHAPNTPRFLGTYWMTQTQPFYQPRRLNNGEAPFHLLPPELPMIIHPAPTQTPANKGYWEV